MQIFMIRCEREVIMIMQISRLTLANLMIAVILLSSPFIVQLTSSAPYDPWADLDGDGDVDIFDIVDIAGRYGTKGDATKNVNVTNWPKGTAVTVWYSNALGSGASELSERYNADGFQLMHLLMYVTGLSDGEQATIQLRGYIYDFNSTTTSIFVTAYSQIFTMSNAYLDLVLYVPTEEFQFRAVTELGTNCWVHLSFYLTR